jgi:phage shock protein PspC (stress-responsive transcriptional regulator)
MNKTVSIHINGKLYNLEELAFSRVDEFLKSIQAEYGTIDSFKNIQKETEQVISFFFQQKLEDKEVITLDEANEIINQLNNESSSDWVKKKLFRDSDDGIIAGVSGGLAYYLAIDPIWIRLLFIVLLFVYGLGLVIYIVLWSIIPRTRSIADKLLMRGSGINLKSIVDKINSDYEASKSQLEWQTEDDVEIWSKDGWQSRTAYFFDRLTYGFVNAFLRFFKFSGRFIGIVMILTGLVLLSFLVWWIYIPIQNEPISIGNFKIIQANVIVQLIFEKLNHQFWSKIALLATFSAPALAMILGGIVIWFKHFKLRGILSVLNGLIFTFGISVLVVLSFLAYKEFRSSALLKENYTYEWNNNQILKISILEKPASKFNQSIKFLGYQIEFNDKDPFITGTTEINFKRAESELLTIKTYKYARGKTNRIASQWLGKIMHFYKYTGESLTINNFFNLKNTNKLRNQRCEVSICIPEKKQFQLVNLPSSTRIISVDEVGNKVMLQSGFIYQMGNNGLICQTCEGD